MLLAKPQAYVHSQNSEHLLEEETSSPKSTAKNICSFSVSPQIHTCGGLSKEEG